MLNAHSFSFTRIVNEFASRMRLESRKNPLAEALFMSIILASFLVMMIRRLWHFNKLAMTDSLTNLSNQRALRTALDQELERARRYHCTFAVLFLDVDYFKLINDIYGHLVGDAILREFAGVVRSLLRRNDTFGRWGGDEFLIIMPDTEEIGAQHVVERIRSTLAKHLLVSGSGFHLTCSMGVATFPSTAQQRELLINAADQAMYIAKCQAHKHEYATPAAHVLESENSSFTKKTLETALNFVHFKQAARYRKA